MENPVINRQHATATFPNGLLTVPAIDLAEHHTSANLNSTSAQAWWVYPVDGSRAPTRFVGSTEEMVAHINARHLATDIQYAAREIGQ